MLEFANGFNNSTRKCRGVTCTDSLKPDQESLGQPSWDVIGVFTRGVAIAYAFVRLPAADPSPSNGTFLPLAWWECTASVDQKLYQS
jgi:hypothetical protein